MSDKTQTPGEPDPMLAAFRKSIDNIDAALIHMLAERFRITQAVGEYKAKVTLPPADPDREARQIARLRKLAEDAVFTEAGVTVREAKDLWDMPAVFLLVALLLGAEWGYRRWRGLA